LTAYAYPARIARAREGGWLIQFRDFPEGHSQAEDGEDIIDIAGGLLQACIEARLLDSMEVDEPSASVHVSPIGSTPSTTGKRAVMVFALAVGVVTFRYSGEYWK